MYSKLYLHSIRMQIFAYILRSFVFQNAVKMVKNKYICHLPIHKVVMVGNLVNIN